MLHKDGWQMSVGCGRKPRSHRVYLHVSIRAGLSTGQRSTLGHGDAALTHLAAKVIPLVSHWALQGTVFSQVRAGVIWKSWGRGHLIVGTAIHQEGMSRYGAAYRNILNMSYRNYEHAFAAVKWLPNSFGISLSKHWFPVRYVQHFNAQLQKAACQKKYTMFMLW